MSKYEADFFDDLSIDVEDMDRRQLEEILEQAESQLEQNQDPEDIA